MNPLIGSSIISGGASLLGGLFGSSSSKKAAKAQLQAVRETNALNKELAFQQNEWNLQQWNRQNAYNDPSAQMARYRAAGINPYFALSNITSGNAEGTLSSADLANQQPVTSPLQGQSGQIFGSALSQAAQFGTSAFYDNQIKAEQAKNLQLKNAFDAQSLMERVNSLRYDNQAKKMANEVYNGSMQSLMNITKNQERQSYIKTAVDALQQVGTSYDVAMKQFQQKYLQPQQYDIGKMNINQMVASIAKMKSEENWNKKQTALAASYAAAALLSSRASWLNASANDYGTRNHAWNETQSTYRQNYTFSRTKEALVKQTLLGVDMLSNEHYFSNFKKDWWSASHFNKFMYGTGLTFDHVSPLKFK